MAVNCPNRWWLGIVVLALFWTQPLSAQFPPGLGGRFAEDLDSPITADAVILPAENERPALLVVTAKIQREFKTYSITQPPGGPIRTRIKIAESSQFSIGQFQAVQKPILRPEPAFNNLMVEEHHGSVTWYAPIKLAEGVNWKSLVIEGQVNAQACNARGCLPPKDHPFEAKIGKSPIELPTALSVEKTVPALPVSELPSVEQSTSNNETVTLDYDLESLEVRVPGKASSLPLMIGAALLAGFILNFMPCVLPVIGLKVLSFLEQGGENPRRVLLLNIWYSLGILAVFWLLALIPIVLRIYFGMQFGWGQQFSDDRFNIILVSIVFAMALSFLGVWEIPIPGFAGGRNAQELARREGALGAFFKGMITTLLATPCSGPFLGTAVAFALKSSPLITVVIFTFMGLGMAAPYLLVGLRPELIKFLPKPGAWMDTFKQFMGFVLIGTVLWLMLPIDAHLLMPTLVLLTGLSASCWWIGRTPAYVQFAHKAKTWAQAIALSGVVGWFAFAAPQTTDPLPWQSFSMASFVGDVNRGKTVLVEFTADWCATCKLLKAANLNRSSTKATVVKNNVVAYEVDIDRLSTQERQFFAKMQPSQGVPLIAIFPSGKKYAPITFGDGYTQSQILDALNQAGPSQAN